MPGTIVECRAANRDERAGHAVGLGHSADPTSVMYPTLNTGMALRTLTIADFAIPDPAAGADALHAAIMSLPAPTMSSGLPAFSTPDHDAFFALLANSATRLALAPDASFQAPAHDSVFPGLIEGVGAAIPPAKLAALNALPIFGAAAPPEMDGDPFAATAHFPDWLQNSSEEQPTPCRLDDHFDFIPADGVVVIEI